MNKNKLLKYYLIFITIGVLQNSAFACTCAGYPPLFCENINDNTYIVKAVVIEFTSAYYMKVKVQENIHQEVHSDTILILGQDGINCGESLFLFHLEDTLILGINDWYVEVDSTWFLSGCGRHFLNVRDGIVTGQISSGINNQPYEEFKENILECINYVPVSVNDLEGKENLLSIFPNPVSDFLYVRSDRSVLKHIMIWDYAGREVYLQTDIYAQSMKLDLSQLGEGLYYVKVISSIGSKVFKCIKVDSS